MDRDWWYAAKLVAVIVIALRRPTWVRAMVL